MKRNVVRSSCCVSIYAGVGGSGRYDTGTWKDGMRKEEGMSGAAPGAVGGAAGAVAVPEGVVFQMISTS